MNLNRSDVQNKIKTLLESNPNKDFVFIKNQLKTWLDSLDLSNGELTHSLMRDHILDDLNSYEGLK